MFTIHGLIGGAPSPRDAPQGAAIAAASDPGRAHERGRHLARRHGGDRGRTSSAATSGSPPARLLAIGPWTVLSWHAWFGLALVPLVVVHLLPRRWRVLRPPAARRRLTTDPAGDRGARRGWRRRVRRDRHPRATSRRDATVHGIAPARPGVDTAGDDVLRRSGAGDRDRCVAPQGCRDLAIARRPPRDRRGRPTAVLDCTSGWAVETTWRGVPLRSVIDIPASGSVRVRSVTGWSTVLDHDEASQALLATAVGGAPLPGPERRPVPARRSGPPRPRLGRNGSMRCRSPDASTGLLALGAK